MTGLGRERMAAPTGQWDLALLLALGLSPETHALRARLLSLVVQYPGLHLRELARMSDLPASHAQYHLRVLEKSGLVASVKQERHVRYYPTKATPVGEVPALGIRERELLQLLRRPAVLRILVVLLLEGPLPLIALSRQCRVTPATTHHHLERILPYGFVVRDEASGAWMLKEEVLVRRLLFEYEPPPSYVEGFLDTWQRLGP